MDLVCGQDDVAHDNMVLVCGDDDVDPDDMVLVYENDDAHNAFLGMVLAFDDNWARAFSEVIDKNIGSYGALACHDKTRDGISAEEAVVEEEAAEEVERLAPAEANQRAK